MFEVEQKFHVDDVVQLEQLLEQMEAIELPLQQHVDVYYNHPSRDFAETMEAFRIRRVDGVPMVTYKGRKLPGAVKARRELEWRLDPGDENGTKTEELLDLLSFRRVAEVIKNRRSFSLPGAFSETTVVIDKVANLGLFAEIEIVVPVPDKIEPAREIILDLGQQLGLIRPEPLSYLRLILASGGED